MCLAWSFVLSRKFEKDVGAGSTRSPTSLLIYRCQSILKHRYSYPLASKRRYYGQRKGIMKLVCRMLFAVALLLYSPTFAHSKKCGGGEDMAPDAKLRIGVMHRPEVGTCVAPLSHRSKLLVCIHVEVYKNRIRSLAASRRTACANWTQSSRPRIM